MKLLSTQEGQLAVMADSGASQSYLKENPPEPEIVPEGLKECVEKEYIYNLQVSGRVRYYFGNRMIAAMNGEISVSEAMAAVDGYYRNGNASLDYDQSVVDEIAKDVIYKNYNVRRKETALGNLVADALQIYFENRKGARV